MHFYQATDKPDLAPTLECSRRRQQASRDEGRTDPERSA